MLSGGSNVFYWFSDGVLLAFFGYLFVFYFLSVDFLLIVFWLSVGLLFVCGWLAACALLVCGLFVVGCLHVFC